VITINLYLAAIRAW